MSGPITRPHCYNGEAGEVCQSVPCNISKSIGKDESQEGIGNNRITIDLGKSVNSIALCAALCGICAAVTVVTVLHSTAQEVSTESQMRKTQNHVDEMTNEVKRLRDRLEDIHHATR